MSEDTITITIDGQEIQAKAGQTILEAADAAGVYIPRLCYYKDLPPGGHCRVCTVLVNGRPASACTFPVSAGQVIENNTESLTVTRRGLIEMLFVEGNHFCPSCEKSGDCKLQATAYELGMVSAHFEHFFPSRPIDASHPDLLLDFNRCILCSLCVRTSRDVDGKNVFALSERGIKTRLIVNAESGLLADTNFSADDMAAHVCPVGVILRKRTGFAVPIGQRTYDIQPISAMPQPKAE